MYYPEYVQKLSFELDTGIVSIEWQLLLYSLLQLICWCLLNLEDITNHYESVFSSIIFKHLLEIL